MGASLTRTLYVLDEPTVGLHARDAARVLGVLRRICRSGNTVLVVEHDPAVVEGADHLIVLGPEGGDRGGELLYEGPPANFCGRTPVSFASADGSQTAHDRLDAAARAAPGCRGPPGERSRPPRGAAPARRPFTCGASARTT